jgi:hypothetical protein
MKVIIAAICILLTLSACSYDPDEICGYVVEYPEDILLEDVSVTVIVYDTPENPIGYVYSTVTGVDGYYSFTGKDLQKKSHILKIERNGFHMHYGGNFNSSHSRWGCLTTALEQD